MHGWPMATTFKAYNEVIMLVNSSPTAFLLNLVKRVLGGNFIFFPW